MEQSPHLDWLKEYCDAIGEDYPIVRNVKWAVSRINELQREIEGLRRENKGLRETINNDTITINSLIEQSSVKDKDIKTLIRANDNYGMVIQQRDREIADKLQRITELSGLNGRLCRERAELQKRNNSQADTIVEYQRETGRWESPSKDEVIDELRNLALKMGIEAGEKDLAILSLEKTYSLLEKDYEARWAELVEAQAELARLRRERNETPVNRIDRLEKIMQESLAEIKEHRRQTR